MNKHSFIKQNRTRVFERFGNLNWSLVSTQLDSWRDGQDGYLSITKKGKSKSREQLGWYYAVILPVAFEAFKDNGDFTLTLNYKDKSIKVDLTKETVDMFLKLRYADVIGEYKDKENMLMAECAAYEDWCVKWLSVWLNCHIPPPDSQWRTNFEKA